MAIAFIAGAVIGGLFAVALVYTYELKTLSRFHKKVDEIEHQFNHLCEIVRTEKRSDYKKFADEVLEMLNMYCDDGNEIYIKKRVLEVNMKSILEEFIVGQDTDAGDNTSE